MSNVDQVKIKGKLKLISRKTLGKLWLELIKLYHFKRTAKKAYSTSS